MQDPANDMDWPLPGLHAIICFGALVAWENPS
jgi:hypothetical protein